MTGGPQTGRRGAGHPAQRSVLLRLARIAALLLAGWLTIMVVMVFFENRLIFFPTRYPDGLWDVERLSASTGCSISDCTLPTKDGINLHGWWCEPDGLEPGAEPMLILWFHGNAGNLSYRIEMLVDLARYTRSRVLIIDYRGYGKSQGRPSEGGLYLDARAAWAYATEQQSVPPSRIVLFGKSLGGAPAVELATAVDPAGLIVQSSFSSIPDMAAFHMPWVPGLMIRTRMDSLSRVGSVACPKLFVHSRADEIVPFELGEKLFEAAADPKAFYEVRGASHNETAQVGGAAYYDELSRFIDRCRE